MLLRHFNYLFIAQEWLCYSYCNVLIFLLLNPFSTSASSPASALSWNISHTAVQSAKASSGKQFWNLDEIHIHRNWTFPAVHLLLQMHSHRTAKYIIKVKDFICFLHLLPRKEIQRCPTEVRKRWGRMYCATQSWVMGISCNLWVLEWDTCCVHRSWTPSCLI